MAGAWSKCKQCGAELWDEETSNKLCSYCGKPHRELPDLEKLVETKVKEEVERRLKMMLEK